MLVDDEVIMLRALRHRVSWQEYGIDEVLSAVSMQQAQEILKRKEVDLLLCDIEMPDGNGLELFEWIKSYFPYVECIYITCHPDFHYIQKALRLGSFDYILKPIDYKELDGILRNALAQVEENRHLKEYVHKKARTMLSEEVGTVQGSAEVVLLIKKYVREHLGDEIATVDLAELVHMNAQYMVRIFKKQEGISVLEYITRERIKTAKSLLRETDYSIYRVAEIVGYPNYSYFTRVFKKMETKTPQEYRKLYHN